MAETSTCADCGEVYDPDVVHFCPAYGRATREPDAPPAPTPAGPECHCPACANGAAPPADVLEAARRVLETQGGVLPGYFASALGALRDAVARQGDGK